MELRAIEIISYDKMSEKILENKRKKKKRR